MPSNTSPNGTTVSYDAGVVHYDKGETEDYQVRQLPEASTSSSPDWEEIFSPFQWSKPIVERTSGGPGTPNLVWKIDPPTRLRGAYVDFDEFGYDEDGYVCRLGSELTSLSDSHLERRHESAGTHREIKEHIESIPVDDSVLPGSPWAGHRFGREWKFGLNGVCDDTLFSIAALQLCRDADLDKPGPLSLSRQGLAKCFLAHFRSKWESSRNLWGSSDHRWSGSERFNGSEDVVFQYHMRAFTAPTWWLRPPGRSVKRVSGPLPSNRHRKTSDAGPGIYELRYSVGLKTTWKLDLPVFTLVTIADSVTASHLETLKKLSSRDEWDTAGIHPSIRATGVAAFAFRIHSLLPQWETQWSNLIDEIGKALNNDLESILSPAHQLEAMIDGNDLQLSKFYFTILQILRTAAEWIRESMDDLRRTVEDMEQLYLSRASDQRANFLPTASNKESRAAAIAMFKQNWETVMSEQKRIGTALIARIAAKQEEAESLRDGLFNATSVSEVKNSAQLNRYILVFTTVTIFYLPLSFMTVRFTPGRSTASN
ncbi:hypothetical protein OQA88_12747 [Cercophora sp. LCS_1]